MALFHKVWVMKRSQIPLKRANACYLYELFMPAYRTGINCRLGPTQETGLRAFFLRGGGFGTMRETTSSSSARRRFISITSSASVTAADRAREIGRAHV